MPTRKKKTTRTLAPYQAKRNFQKTPEPSGASRAKLVKSAGKPGKGFFCIQKHLASHLHYDFRLEHEGVLLSWAVPKGPSLNPRDKRLAMRVEDHPLDYGDFEGVIPEGYGAGIVMLWDRGTWKPEPQTPDIAKALVAGELKFTLDGTKLKGSWVLVRTGHSDTGESRTWLLLKHKDDWAGPIDVVTAAPLSVKSFGDLPDILAADKPDIWESNRPAKGGAAGEMLSEIIDKAARLKAGRRGEPKQPRTKAAPSERLVIRRKRRNASNSKQIAKSADNKK